MKKELIKLGLVAGIATTSLFGFTYEIKQGWQQLGAIKDFDDLKPFDDASCVEYLWYYDLDEPVEADKWKLHISDGKTYNYCGKTFSSLDKGDGFWLKASGECNITVTEPNNCNTSSFPTPPSLDGSTCDTNVSNPDGNLIINNKVITTNKISPEYDTNVSARNLKSIQFNIQNYQKDTHSYFVHASASQRFYIGIYQNKWYIGIGNLTGSTYPLSADTILNNSDTHTIKFEFKDNTQTIADFYINGNHIQKFENFSLPTTNNIIINTKGHHGAIAVKEPGEMSKVIIKTFQ